ncbi:J domain-containing protein required for chloroplast accumulation response 1 isoform X3 [Manihot esculenta]|nr:J domain-containing protein required for chloroplast accumulation response 1 isoform X3 [Manihot esculenta]
MNSPCRNSSDVDFNDVFGGPPRRLSIQEVRRSCGESGDSYALRSDEETSLSRSGWSGLSEKPVFGEGGVSRRRYPNDDFFDDIFTAYSPTKSSRDPFSSAPGSRVLSPVHPLPLTAEHSASSSQATQFSCSLGNIQYTSRMFLFSTCCLVLFFASLPKGLTCQLLGPVPVIITEIRMLLQLEQSLSKEESSNIVKPNEMAKGNDFKMDSKSSEGPNISNQFHFSIYKWASKGIPLPLPLAGGNSSKWKEKFKFERSSSASGRIACEGMATESPTVIAEDTGCPSFNISISSDAKSSEVELDQNENGSLFNRSTNRKLGGLNSDKAIPTESEIPCTHQEDGPDNIIFQNSYKETKPHFVLGTGFSGKVEKKNSVATQEALRSPLIGTDEITTQNELKEDEVKSIKRLVALFDFSEKIEKKDGNVLHSEKMDKTNLRGSPTNSLAKSRGKGKVREFVKIFNQAASNNSKFCVDSQSQSSRWNDRGKFKTEDDVDFTSTRLKEKMHLPNVNKNNTLDPCIVVDEFLMRLEKQHSETRNSNHKSTAISPGLKDRSASTAGPIPDGSEAIAGDPDDSFQGNILIKELSQGEDELPQAGDIQFINDKIWKWSNGREGNIRSLLSTLQYILWPESGWKPVPLVDIIEGNAVKRSYQKALLFLHPDKLQQKGATSHQKYIAEKVFDILQEAWTHFNSLGSV